MLNFCCGYFPTCVFIMSRLNTRMHSHLMQKLFTRSIIVSLFFNYSVFNIFHNLTFASIKYTITSQKGFLLFVFGIYVSIFVSIEFFMILSRFALLLFGFGQFSKSYGCLSHAIRSIIVYFFEFYFCFVLINISQRYRANFEINFF